MGNTISVQSAGRRSDQDYSWSTAKDNALNASEELRSSFALLDGSPSLLVERTETGFFVLLAGFSSSRFDYRGRTICNSVAWDGLDENQATELAITFLRQRGEIQKKLEKAIRASEAVPSGYEVLWEELEKIDENRTKLARPSNDVRERHEIPWSEANELANELERDGWPESPRLLLVATKLSLPNAEREILKRGVWRFLHTCDSKRILTAPEGPKVVARPGPGIKIPLTVFVILSVILVVVVIKWPKTSPKAERRNPPPTTEEGVDRTPMPTVTP